MREFVIVSSVLSKVYSITSVPMLTLNHARARLVHSGDNLKPVKIKVDKSV